eukprot:GHVU01064342.1.p1 GENE.GHVU01064342.1~~GHVU01064342.1.p1  ORF type:complete len:118 (+),score=21.76 GHVU01064342.1:142-495(+)
MAATATTMPSASALSAIVGKHETGPAGNVGTSPAVDLFVQVKKLERKLELLCIQEEYVKEEHKDLRRELLRAKEEIRRIQSVPLVIGQFLEMIDANNGVLDWVRWCVGVWVGKSVCT